MVRRLTNFSTGKLGSELAAFLSAHGHKVTLFLGEMATYCGQLNAERVQRFTTTENLRMELHMWANQRIDAVFHAAAISDFGFGRILKQSRKGDLVEIDQEHLGKISTRDGTLLAELVPTPKIIAQLRSYFPAARLVGWKYEVDGDKASVVRQAKKQIAECQTDACVANGPAYGQGFGLVRANGTCAHFR